MVKANAASADLVASYNQYYYSLAPFVDLTSGQVVTLVAFVSRED